jgi:CRP-like cAMP-binding protein
MTQTRHDGLAVRTRQEGYVSETANLFLSSLSAESRAWLLERATPVQLPIRTVLYASEQRPVYAYLMTSGMASVVTSMQNGGTAEVSVVGREGIVGALHLLGPGRPATDCFIQIRGSALRIKLADLQIAFRSFPDVHDRLLEFVQEQCLSLAQIAACNRLHGAEERLARWLLSVQDRTQSEEMQITQELLAQMLGAKRTTVTVVAATMQMAGLISYSRGKIRILNRENLEAAACECYGICRKIYFALYSEPIQEFIDGVPR